MKKMLSIIAVLVLSLLGTSQAWADYTGPSIDIEGHGGYNTDTHVLCPSDGGCCGHINPSVTIGNPGGNDQMLVYALDGHTVIQSSMGRALGFDPSGQGFDFLIAP